MPEAGDASIEIAQQLSEKNERKMPRSSHSEFYIEILEAIILALVAADTAYMAIKRRNGMDCNQSSMPKPTC